MDIQLLYTLNICAPLANGLMLLWPMWIFKAVISSSTLAPFMARARVDKVAGVDEVTLFYSGTLSSSTPAPGVDEALAKRYDYTLQKIYN